MELAPRRPLENRAYRMVILAGIIIGKLLARGRKMERRVFVSILFGLAIANIVLEAQDQTQANAQPLSQAANTVLELK